MSSSSSSSSCTVHIGNLNSQITEEQLLYFLSSCGTITNVKMAGDPNYPSRFAFVEFQDSKQAQNACKLNGMEFGGKPLKIQFSKNPITTPYKALQQQQHQQQQQYQNRNPYHHQQQQQQQHYQVRHPSQSSHHQQAAMIPTVAMPSYIHHHQQQQQQQHHHHNTRHVSDSITRTIYVAGIDGSMNEQSLLEFFSYYGTVTNYRLCGDVSHPTRFAFFEFSTQEQCMRALSLTGSTLGRSTLRISLSKTPIQSTSNSKSSLTASQREQVERTVHVGSVDVKVSEDQVKEFFQSSCGAVTKVAMAGDTSQHATRFAFIEFQHQESARAALKLNGTELAGRALKVHPSKSPILSGSTTKGSKTSNVSTGHVATATTSSGIPANYAANPSAYATYNYGYPYSYGYTYPTADMSVASMPNTGNLSSGKPTTTATTAPTPTAATAATANAPYHHYYHSNIYQSSSANNNNNNNNDNNNNHPSNGSISDLKNQSDSSVNTIPSATGTSTTPTNASTKSLPLPSTSSSISELAPKTLHDDGDVSETNLKRKRSDDDDDDDVGDDNYDKNKDLSKEVENSQSTSNSEEKRETKKQRTIENQQTKEVREEMKKSEIEETLKGEEIGSPNTPSDVETNSNEDTRRHRNDDDDEDDDDDESV